MTEQPYRQPGEAGLRHYALLTGKPHPRNDNAATGNRGEVGKAKQRARTNSSAHPRRLPAYGAQVATLRAQGMRPVGDVIARLDTWPARKRPDHVLFPQIVVSSEAEAADLDFSFLTNIDVFVAHWRSKSERQRLRSLLREILKVNPRRLIVLDVERDRLWWVKSVDRGVEVEL